MRRIGFLLFILALEILLVLDMHAQKVFGLDGRDVLIQMLGEEVSQFVEMRKLSGEDQETVSEILGSLFRDPPLKTVEERMASSRLIETPVAVFADEEQKELKTRIESLLKRHHRKNTPIPIVTPDQMHDLDRLFKLNDVFRKRHLQSKAIGKLIELVFERIEMAIAA